MSDKKRFNKPGSLQPNIEDILQWNDLPADAFDPATSEEKENFSGIAKRILLEGCMEDVFVKTRLRWWHW